MRIKRILSFIRPWAVGIGFGGSVLVLVAALVLDKGLGKDVLMIIPHEPAVVQLNQNLYVPGDPVAEIYGNPMSDPVRIVNPSSEKLIRPEENEELLLLRVDKLHGENPLQAQTVWFFARFALPALLVLGIIGLFLPRAAGRHGAAAGP
jgi:hypothetical protein